MDRRERFGDHEEMLRMAFDGLQASLWTALPGIVESFNAAENTCEIQPAIQAVILDEHGVTTLVDLPLLLDCPVVWSRGGGFTLTFPIQKGDEALVVFSSRCIDSWWEAGSGDPTPPAELRFHDLSDGFVIIGPRSKPKAIQGISATTTQLRSDDGSTYVEVGNGVINLVAPSQVTITSPQTTCTGNLTVEGLLTFEDGVAGHGGGNGNAIEGTLTVTTGDVVADSIHLKTHTHGGVTTGGGNTGAPNP